VYESVQLEQVLFGQEAMSLVDGRYEAKHDRIFASIDDWLSSK